MKKVLDIYSLMQDEKNDITSIIMRRHYPDKIEYEYPIDFRNHFRNLPPTSKYWKQTLHEIYIKSPGQYGGGNPSCADDNILAKKIKITGEELHQTTIFLTEHEMISLESNHAWRITQKGFDVAVQNETIASNKKIQHFIVCFMFISALAAVVQVVLAAMK